MQQQKHANRRWLIGVVAIVTVLVGAVMLLQIDDDLDPEAQVILDMVSISETSEAYLYLLGIHANQELDPLEVGTQIYESIQQVEKEYFAGNQEANFSIKSGADDVVLPAEDFICQIRDDGCLRTMFASFSEYKEFLEVHNVVLERYKTFVRFDDYQTMTRPTLEEPFPVFQNLITGNRLLLLSAIYELSIGNSTSAVAGILDNVEALRNIFSQSDNLILKMTIASMISENLDVLSVVSQHFSLSVGYEIPYFSADELSTEKAFAREFAMARSIHKNLDTRLQLQSVSPGISDWLFKLVFKPNMTTNAIAPFYQHKIELSEQDSKGFADEVLEENEFVVEPSRIRNFVGSILNDVDMPGYEKYVARPFDLNTKIALLNQITNIDFANQNIEEIQNPYYPGESTAYFSEDRKSICLTGPLEDDYLYRCLRIAL